MKDTSIGVQQTEIHVIARVSLQVTFQRLRIIQYDKKNYEDSWVAAHYEDSWVAALVRKILEPAMSELFTSCPIGIEHRMITPCVRTKSESHEGSSRLLNYVCGSCSR